MGITRFSTHAHVLLTQSAPFVLSNTNNTTMGLGAIITALFEPCRSAPKSPPCPSPDKQTDADRRATANASERTIVEVLPCGDVTNITPCGDASSPTKPVSHAPMKAPDPCCVSWRGAPPSAVHQSWHIYSVRLVIPRRYPQSADV